MEIVEEKEEERATVGDVSHEAFTQWALHVVGVKRDSIELSSLPPPYGRGFIVTNNIGANKTVLTIPQHAFINSQTLVGHPVSLTSHSLMLLNVCNLHFFLLYFMQLEPFIEAHREDLEIREEDIVSFILLYERFINVRSSCKEL